MNDMSNSKQDGKRTHRADIQKNQLVPRELSASNSI